MNSYSHTQKAPFLILILYGSSLACLALAFFIGDNIGVCIAGSVGLFIAALAPAFHHLIVQDEGDVLAIHFGPVPLFRKAVRYADIENAEVGRTTILDGWGIHLSIRDGWIWNLWGRDCVVIRFKIGGALRVGTDDADNFAGFIAPKINRA